ncbi:hypothetical protein TSUD_141540 [Trifolium subterraneum]|uniref:RNase H type-1 domain-containing protein n=1 Tax=Trifolium subterraneum TaxID=3900 RepID=A0A2Z6P390_TRISU|nr:hypothetical protein TSUD_141540 [Trifolium subterraneum]
MNETIIDKEYDVGDVCFLSGSESDDSDWSIGWDVAEKILETPLVSSVREDKVVATNIMLWAIGMVFGKLKLRTRHVIYFDAYVEDVSRLVLDCWNDEWNVLSIVLTTEADVVRWEKSSLDWVKCNVDVAFVSGSGRTSMGLCFRDNSGHFMSGMTQWQQTVISSVEREAWALLLAMEEARHRGLNRVQFESDSKVLIEAIHMKRRGNSEFLSIVHDILSLMSSFINFEVKFVRRQTNLVAHTLARAANSWASFHRFENIPFCIERLVFNEMQ